MKLVFIMDPYDTLNLETETSLLLMKELLLRGHQVFWSEQSALSLNHAEPMALVEKVKSVEPFEKAGKQACLLNSFYAIFTRIDPPFNQNYLHLSYILDHVDESVVQFNPASALRNLNEKLLALRWPDFVPPSLVTQNAAQIFDFLSNHKQLVLKPLDDCSGRGVVKVEHDQINALAIIERALLDGQGRPQYIQAQKFLGEVSQGDKRVYLLNGEAVGVVNRLPQEGNFLANIHQGARCEAGEVSLREQYIIDTMRPFLLNEGITLAGLDFIGGYITEVNITSPSAIRQINTVSDQEIQKVLVDGIEARLKNKFAKACCDSFYSKAS